MPHCKQRVSTLIVACASGLVGATYSAHAMGYDSLACAELAERRIGYFTSAGYCAPGVEAASCKPAPDGVKSLPPADQTQVEMIVKVEVRKGCNDPSVTTPK